MRAGAVENLRSKLEKYDSGQAKIYKYASIIVIEMVTEIETIKEEIHIIRTDLDYIKTVLSEDFELSEYAKKELKEARETPESEYVDLE